MAKSFSVVSLLILASCGDGGTPDARPSNIIDGAVVDASDFDSDAPTIDGSPGTIDATPTIDADTTPDAGSSGTVCGGDVCDATEQCCTMGGGGGPPTQMCIPATDTCGGLPSTCDGPEDCSGSDVCCQTLQGASCGATCTGVELCHTNPDCTAGICCPAIGGVSVCVQLTMCF